MTSRGQPHSRVRQHLLAALALLGLTLAFWTHHVHIARPAKTGFLDSDLVSYHYPAAVHMKRELDGGSLAWNPHQLAGMPFLATHTPGALYPPARIALRLFRPARALEILTVFHLALAGFSTWLFLSRLGLGPVAGLTGAIAFMLSGMLERRIYHLAGLSTIVWLPLILWAVHSLLSEPRFRRVAALSAVLSLAFLGGYAQGFLMEVQLASAYGLVGLLLVTRKGERLRVVASASLAGALFLGLVAAQLLPTLELARRSARVIQGLTATEASRAAPSPRDMLNGLGLAWPSADGAPDVFWRVAALTIPLLAFGLADRRRRGQWFFFTAAALFAGLFMLGDRTPVFPAYFTLTAAPFRYPVRILFVFTFCLAVLTAIGVEGVAALLKRREMRRLRGAALSTMVPIVILIIIGTELYVRREVPHTVPILSGETRYAPDELVDFLGQRTGEGRAFIEIFEWFTASRALQPTLGMVNGLFALPAYEPLMPKAYVDYFGGGPLWRGFIHVVRLRHDHPNFFSITTPDEISALELRRLLDLMSVRYYVAEKQQLDGQLSDLQSFVGAPGSDVGSTLVLERSEALPRVYTVGRVQLEPDPARARRKILDTAFAPHYEAVVDRPLPMLEGAGSGLHSARIVSSHTDRVVIDATCGSDCLLVLTDLYYPDWEARVDDTPAQIVRVNTLFRGVHLTPGAHRVAYLYRPRALRIGAAISIATLILLAVVTLRRALAPPRRLP